MKPSHATTRITTLAVAISSVFLGALAAQADQHVEPSPDQRVQADTEATEVGSPKSNVDKDSSSGSYYPYSAGTVGDDPAEPKSTSVPTDASDSDPGPTDQWSDEADSDGDGYLTLAELTKAAPALSASFEAMDVDGDGKLTRGEFRTWHESRKARASADNETSSPMADSTPRSTAPPDDGGH
jgi:hypothetical protein